MCVSVIISVNLLTFLLLPCRSGYSNEVLQDPGLILKIDLSLNGIREVAVDDIAVFPELRSLDLSLNAIQKFQVWKKWFSISRPT